MLKRLTARSMIIVITVRFDHEPCTEVRFHLQGAQQRHVGRLFMPVYLGALSYISLSMIIIFFLPYAGSKINNNDLKIPSSAEKEFGLFQKIKIHLQG